MKILADSVLITVLLSAGCTHSQTAARPADPGRNNVVYTGSRIPQPRDRITTAPLSANTPPESVSRHPDSLIPTEPVVGATDNTGGNADTGPVPSPH